MIILLNTEILTNLITINRLRQKTLLIEITSNSTTKFDIDSLYFFSTGHFHTV